MTPTTQPSAPFTDTDTRAEDMRAATEDWLHELGTATDDVRASDRFQAWFDVQSRFHEYSYRNTLLIHRRCPGATRVAGYRTWQTDFDRHVCEGDSAIWTWGPIIARRCPDCGNARSYHEASNCAYDETSPEEWSRGLIGFKPVPVFDVSQTEGEPLPELETAATGEAAELVSVLEAASNELDVSLRIVTNDEWAHGDAKGVCQWRGRGRDRPHVAVLADLADADRAVTLVHEYAHAHLHVHDATEQAKREVEAEAVAYVVGQHFDLDVDGSASYLAAWAEDAPATIEERLDRISETAQKIIDAVNDLT